MSRFLFNKIIFILLIGLLSSPIHANKVLTVQELLTKLGYDPGPTDGEYGNKIELALNSYYISKNKKYDGDISANELNDLVKDVYDNVESCQKSEETSATESLSHQHLQLDLFSTFLPQVKTNLSRYAWLSNGRRLSHFESEHAAVEIKLIADFNNDGLDDVMLEYAMVNMPPVFLISNGDGTFTERDNLSSKLSRVQIRKAVAADFDSDGFLDIAGFTTADPWKPNGWTRGEPDILLMNVEGKTFREVKIPEWTKDDWNHGGSAADIDGDGNIDILPVSEEPNLKTGPIRNNGKEIFKKGITEYSSLVSRHLSSSLATGDLNGDGHVDLVFALTKDVSNRPGSSNTPKDLKFDTIQIIYGDGDFNFRNNKKISFGKHWLTPDIVNKIIKNKNKYTEADMPTAASYVPGVRRLGLGTSNVELIDINQDGLLDIVAGYIFGPTSLQMSSGFKVFINKGNCFNDETAIFFPNQRMNRDITPGAQSSYTHRFYFDDITGDNLPDLILQMDGYMDFLNSEEPYSPNVFVNNGSNVYLPLLKKNAIRHKIAPYKKQNYTDGGLKESLTNNFHSVGDFDGDGRADLAFIRVEHNMNDFYVMLQRSKLELDEEKKRKDQLLKNINGYHEVNFNLKNEKVADALMVIKGNEVKFTNINYSKTKFKNSLKHLNAYIEGGNILTLRSYNLGKFGYCLFLRGEVVFNNILRNTRYDYGMPGKEDCRMEANLWPISLKIGEYTSTEDYQKKQKAERQRKREMLFSFDGIYKVQLGQNRNFIDGKMYQDLGSILFSLNRGQPNFDKNNILHKAFGLNEFKFSLDYDGYMTISGLISSKLDTEQKCVYIAGNLKSDKEFIPQSSQNCRADGQNFLMKFEKISDDINFKFAQEEELKKLDGEYDVQWFITGINSTERSLYAKDTLTLSKGVGAFSGNEEDKQPSSELRKELSVQYNANGDIVILGPLDLMEKLDVKQWHASGKIHPNEKTTIKTVWGLGDVIELEIENEELRRKRETEEKKKEAELKKLKEERRKKEQARLQRLEDEKRKQEKAERLRKREMLLSYDGIYKVQLGQNRNLIDGKMYQDLGSILFTLNRGKPNLDDNNILYQALGLNEINFSVDYDGYMIVSGQILSNIDTDKKCVYIAGNLKLDKKFNPKSSQNCRASGQNFSMKFKKISDDINFIFDQEKALKELEGEYNVQWFITGINSTYRTLRAKDTLTLSNGVGVFSGNDPNKQPSSELRKELLVQYNANGDIVILGPLDLMEKKDVKQWHASGKIHPTEKILIKTVWGFGDIIELEIEKSKIVEVSKVIKPERLIDDGYFIYDEKNNSYQLNRYDEITGINQIDFSLSIDSDNEKLFNGDIAYSTSTNNFETTWIDLKIKETNEVLQNIKIGFVIEERSFPNFAKAFSISKNECGVFEDMADDSFIIPLKTDDLTELELFDCHIKVLQKNLNEDNFGILKDRINTAVSLVDTIEITNKYF